MKSRFGMATRVLVLAAFVLLPACSDDDEAPTNPGNGGGGSSQAAQAGAALIQFESTYLAPNEPIGESLEQFIPAIAAFLNAPAPGALGIDGVTSCFDAGLLGKTYEFNGTNYVESPLSGAPSDAVRFLLYEIMMNGTPDLQSVIGHADVTCTPGQQGEDISIVINYAGIDVLTIQSTGGSGQSVFLTGSLNANGAPGPQAFSYSVSFVPLTAQTPSLAGASGYNSSLSMILSGLEVSLQDIVSTTRSSSMGILSGESQSVLEHQRVPDGRPRWNHRPRAVVHHLLRGVRVLSSPAARRGRFGPPRGRGGQRVLDGLCLWNDR